MLPSLETKESLSLKASLLKTLTLKYLDVDVLAGTPFMEANDVAVRPAKREVILGDGTVYEYGSSIPKGLSTTARRAFLIRTPTPPPKRLQWRSRTLQSQGEHGPS